MSAIVSYIYFKELCDALVYHWEIVTKTLFSSFANHFAVLFFSTKTNFRRFISLTSILHSLIYPKYT